MTLSPFGAVRYMLLLWLAGMAATGNRTMAAPVYAVVIGINAYKGVEPLQGAGNDADLIAGQLQSLAGDIVLLKDGMATRQRILEAITVQGAKAAASNAVLVVTYAGHGWQEPEKLPGDEVDGKDEAWLLAGFSRRGPGSGERLLDNDLNAALRAIPSHVPILFLSDSCHSGTMTRSIDQRASGLGSRMAAYGPIEADALPRPDPATLRSELTDLPNLIFAGASQESEQTPELLIAGKAHGALSWQFVRALNGEADLDGNGSTSLAEFRSFMVGGTRQLAEGRQLPVVSFLPGRSAEAWPLPVGSAQPAVQPVRPMSVWFINGTPPAEFPGDLVLAKSRQLADLVVDLAAGEVLGMTSGDVLAQRKSSDQWPALLAGVAEKQRALPSLRRTVERRAVGVNLGPLGAGARYAEDMVVDIQLDAAAAGKTGYVTGFNLSGDGTVQRLFPLSRPADQGRLQLAALPRLAARVTPPFGTDHVVLVISSEPPEALRQRLLALDGQRAAGQLIMALESLLPPGQNSIGLVGLVTGTRNVRP